jgi:two-component system chemotaxis response regulator CheY
MHNRSPKLHPYYPQPVAYFPQSDATREGRPHRTCAPHPGRPYMAKTILIVDDNAYIRQVLCQVFKSEADFEVCGEAENGKEAIAKALELHPNLIVLDLSMPVMNGLDAARELKQLMPTVPLIMYSSFGDAFMEQQARLVGISELVSKSQPAAILISKARDLL